MGFSDCGRRGLGFVGDDMGVGSVAGDGGWGGSFVDDMGVSFEIWPWKLGVGEEASLG